MGAGHDDVVRQVRRMADEVATPLGLEVVDVVFRRQGKHTLLRVDIDRPGLAGATLRDCEQVSRELEARLDPAELLEDSYDLQVSTPGIDRPIRTEDDARRNAGRRIVLETTEEVHGHRCFRGVLTGLRDGAFQLDLGEGHEVLVPADRVVSARQDVDLDLRAGPLGRTKPFPRKRRGIV